MRLFFILCSISLWGVAQSNRVELQVKTDDKITAHGFSYWQSLHIQSADTAFALALHKKNPDVITNLKAGNYTVTVTSIFNTQVHKKVTLKKKTSLVQFKGLANLYHKTLDSSLSQKVKLNDTLYIVYSTPRNEESNLLKIGITKTAKGITAILYEGLSNNVFSSMQCPQDLYKYVLDSEKTGKNLNAPKAETTDNKEVYTIELKKEINSFTIPGTWRGLDKLRAILFAVQK